MSSEKDFYYKKSRLNQLRGFCNVVQCDCSGVRAAEKSNIEPAAISKQISSLERDLGTKLFERSRGHRLSLTKEGRLFYELAIKQMQGMDSLFESFNEHLKDFNDNHLNLALHYMAATYVFPNIIGNLLKQKKFKNIKIDITEISKSEALKKLENKEVDLIYFPFDTDEEPLNKFEIVKNIKNNHSLILSRNHPLANKEKITMKDLNEFNFLVRGKNVSFAVEGYTHLCHSNIIIEDCSVDTSIELVKSTKSITAIPEKLVKFKNLMQDPNIICKNINYLFHETYFYVLTLKNTILKDSIKFILNELAKIQNT